MTCIRCAAAGFVVAAGIGAACSPSGDDLAASEQLTRNDYLAVDLGTLGGASSHALEINARGQVVGSSVTAAGETHAFVWDQGAMTDLGTLGGTESWPADVNAAGQVVGYSYTASGEEHAFFWDSGVMTDLGTFGGELSGARALNNDGVVVGYAMDPGGKYRAFRWQPGAAMTDLGTLGGESAQAYAINELGQIVGYADSATETVRAFLWDAGEMTDLGPFIASGINDNGQVIGVDPSPAHSEQAYVWDAGTLTAIGEPPSDVTAIDARGQVVGWVGGRIPRSRAGFMWQAGELTDLGSLGGNASWATDINARGQIVGGSLTSGMLSVFIWQRGVMIHLSPLPIAYDQIRINERGQVIATTETTDGDHATLWTKRSRPVRCEEDLETALRTR